jgi:single-strand DNA-binding protein
MLNKVILQGRLVNDPELKTTRNGTSVTSFRLAVERDFKDQSGQKVTDFFTVIAWRGTAEFVSKYFAKGRMAVVEGQLQSRSYTGSDEARHTAIEVVASNIYFGDSKRETVAYAAAPQKYAAPATPPNYGVPQPGEDQFEEMYDDDGELPF